MQPPYQVEYQDGQKMLHLQYVLPPLVFRWGDVHNEERHLYLYILEGLWRQQGYVVDPYVELLLLLLFSNCKYKVKYFYMFICL